MLSTTASYASQPRTISPFPGIRALPTVPSGTETGAILIRTAPDEYILAGCGTVVKFEHESETAMLQKLGEDGFLDSGADRKEPSKWKGTKRIGLAQVAEMKVSPDGSLTPVRYLNGDETHQGRHVRICVDDFKILRVKLYEY